MAVMALRKADAWSTPGASMPYAGGTHRHRHSGTALRQPPFDWKAPDQYVELLQFETEVMNTLTEVMNIFKTRTYKLMMKTKSLS